MIFFGGMAGKEVLPEHLRCNRTDGRSWRCGRPVKDGKKLCEIHYLQGLHRQHREKVPESLKIQREYSKKLIKKKKKKGEEGLEIRAEKIEKPGKRSVKLKRRNLARELVRMVVKREVEKRKEAEEGAEGDMMRRLPNGIMVISQSPARPRRDSGNAAPLSDVKVGVDLGIAPRRRFRSKNIEPLPIGSVQVLPYKRDWECVKRGGGRKKCHWCKRSDSSTLIKCSSCRKEFYCLDCIKERYFHTQEEVKIQCPVCRRTCSCEECTASLSQATICEEPPGDKSRADRILNFHYLICVLLPVLKQIDQEQSVELQLEAKVKGLEISELQIKHHEFGSKPSLCNNCKTSIFDLHRSCSSCSYVLCLSCWSGFCQTVFPKGMQVLRDAHAIGKKSFLMEHKELNGTKSDCENEQENCSNCFTCCLSLPYSKACNNVGGISCPTREFGGCGNGIFDLRSSFPLNWIKDLENKAEEVVCSYDYPEAVDGDSCCSICDGANYGVGFEHLKEAAMRKYSKDNLLYCHSPLEVSADKREHFQKHWGRGHPVVVRDVLRRSSRLDWDPVVMFYTYLEGSIAKQESNQGLPPCLECCEVEISIKQFFWGPLRGRTQSNTGQEMLKLKAWLASRYFRQQFPDHYAEIIRKMPLQEYVNHEAGILNLVAKSQLEPVPLELGPYVYISYNSSEDHRWANCVSKLGCDLYDTVNILAHTTDDLISSENLSKIRKLMRKHQAQNERDPTSTRENQCSPSKGDQESPSCAEDPSGLGETSAEGLVLQQKMSRVCWVSSEELPSSSYETQSTLQDPSPVSCSISETTNLKAIQNSEESRDRNFCRDKRERNGYLKEEASKSCGAQWDIFRREDVPKLMEYFQRHASEFVHPLDPEKNAVHPILEQCYFLDEAHKTKLMEEFKIEPWTVEQHVGEAVIVPMGCPYQIRTLKSCVSVVAHFVSPESVRECIHLMDEIRGLPDDHGTKLNKLEVKRMALNSLNSALKQIQQLTCAKQIVN